MRALLSLYREAWSSLPASIWWLCSVALVNRAGSMVVPFLTLWLTRNLGMDLATAGWLMACFGAGSMAGSYLGGRWTDRFGALPVQFASLAGSGVLFVLLGQLESAVAIGVVLALLGLFADAFRPANFAMLANNTPPELRNKAFALARLAVNLGWSIGPAVGGLLARHSYAALFWIDGATSIAAAALLVCIRHRLRSGPRAVSAKESSSPFRDPPYLLAMVASFVIGMVFMQFFFTMPLHYSQSYGLEEDSIGMLTALNSVLIILFEMTLVHAVAGCRRLRLVALGSILFAVGFGMMPFGSSMGFAALSVAIWTVGEMLESPSLMGWCSVRAGANGRGAYMGLLAMVHSLAFMLAPLVGTTVFKEYGPTTLWLGCGVLGGVAAGGFLIADRMAHHDPRGDEVELPTSAHGEPPSESESVAGEQRPQ